MKYLHTMVRVSDLDKSLHFYCDQLGLRELRRHENRDGRYTLVFLAAPGDESAVVELTWNWDPEDYGQARNFGHLAYAVEDIRKVAPCRPASPGCRCRIRESGELSVLAGDRTSAHPSVW